jgi:hypothetical protein
MALQRFIGEQFGPELRLFLASDPDQIRPGEIWLEKIRAELAGASVTLLFASPAAIKREWVNFEAGAAWILGQVIIPVCVAGLTVQALPRLYADCQAVALVNDAGAYLVLLGIATALNLPQPLPPPPKATQHGRAFQHLAAYDRLRAELRSYGYRN